MTFIVVFAIAIIGHSSPGYLYSVCFPRLGPSLGSSSQNFRIQVWDRSVNKIFTVNRRDVYVNKLPVVRLPRRVTFWTWKGKFAAERCAHDVTFYANSDSLWENTMYGGHSWRSRRKKSIIKRAFLAMYATHRTEPSGINLYEKWWDLSSSIVKSSRRIIFFKGIYLYKR